MKTRSTLRLTMKSASVMPSALLVKPTSTGVTSAVKMSASIVTRSHRCRYLWFGRMTYE